MMKTQDMGVVPVLKLLVNRSAVLRVTLGVACVVFPAACGEDGGAADHKDAVNDNAGADAALQPDGEGDGAAADAGPTDAAASDAGQGDGEAADSGSSDAAGPQDGAETDLGAGADGGAAGASGLLCMPCRGQVDCAAVEGAGCLSYGDNGSYCGIPCSKVPGAPKVCPAGFECRVAADDKGALADYCMKVDAAGGLAECGCSALAVARKATTFCSVSAGLADGIHACTGKRACGPAGLSACSAPKPVTETCDGVDQDCDGATDEGTCADQDACSSQSCEPAKGCVTTNKSGDCDKDDNPCTIDACAAGACVKKADKGCDDGNSCTADSCAKAAGCVNKALGPIACSDDDACTGPDKCGASGVCQPGPKLDCDDGKACTTDTCDGGGPGKVGVGCVHKSAVDGAPCEDGNVCTAADTCAFGTCKSGKPLDCDDGTSCTADTCVAGKGCVSKPAKTAANCTCKEPDVLGGPGTAYSTFGQDAFVRYSKGTLPLILSAPHGGALKPATIPDRKQGTTANDSHSRETTLLVARELALATGRRPHVIINRLARIKLDANREIVEAAQGSKAAEGAWKAYHGFIDAAKADITGRCGKGLYVDMHTHGHKTAWVELGYALSAKELASTNAVLDGAALVAKSSMRALPGWSGAKHSAVLRGADSLGGLLQAKKFVAVPSPKHPHPAGKDYFSGGYSTRRHGSRDGGSVDGVQIETRWSLMDTDAERAVYAKALAASLLGVLLKQHGVEVIDKSHNPPANERCSKAAKLGFVGDTASVAGLTTFAKDEFAKTVSCKSGYWLDGPQLYYEVELKAGQSYEVEVLADFPARAFLTAKVCTASKLSSACSKSPLKGQLLTPHVATKVVYKAAKSGPHILAVDSSAPHWHGAFLVAVKALKGP